MRAKFDVDAPGDLANCDPDDIYLNIKLVYPGDVAVEICPDSEIDWAAAVTLIESGATTWLGSGGKGGIGVNNNIVKIVSPDGGGGGSVITVTIQAALCLDAFRRIRDVTAEFAADPVEFARRLRQQG